MKKFNNINLTYHYYPAHIEFGTGVTYLVGDNNTGKTVTLVMVRLLQSVIEGYASSIQTITPIDFKDLNLDLSRFGVESIYDLVSRIPICEKATNGETVTFDYKVGDYQLHVAFDLSDNVGNIKFVDINVHEILKKDSPELFDYLKSNIDDPDEFSKEEIDFYLQEYNEDTPVETPILTVADGNILKMDEEELCTCNIFLESVNVIFQPQVSVDQLPEVYRKYLEFNEIHSFIIKWISEFNIGSDYKVKDGKFTILDTEGHKIHCGDGSIGILNFILGIAFYLRFFNLSKNPKSLVILINDSPEYGLHPNIQSRLAEFFWEVSQEYGVQFVVETHSEYLIRNTQVIVAKECKSGRTIEEVSDLMRAYEFRKDSSTELVRYRDDGMISTEFDTGFYDVSSLLAFELF